MTRWLACLALVGSCVGATYNLTGAVQPAIGSTTAPPDALLQITFDQRPSIGNGYLRVYNTAGQPVDTVNVLFDVDNLGPKAATTVRSVNYLPTTIENATVTFQLHCAVLSYNENYYVTLDRAVIVNASIRGVPFDGIDHNVWSFTTRQAHPTGDRVVVSRNNPPAADFQTVQGALNYAMGQPDVQTTVALQPGVYREMLYVHGTSNLTLQGDDGDNAAVQIAYDNHDGLNPGSGAGGPRFNKSSGGAPMGGRAVLLADGGADLLALTSLTVRNAHIRNGSGDQAEAVIFQGNRLAARRCVFLSEQDTLELNGFSWFHECHVSGNVDFVWGGNEVTLFESCIIESVGVSNNPTDGGYCLQARTSSLTSKGFVYLNCSLTKGPAPGGAHQYPPVGAVYLARSAGKPVYFDNAAYVNCKMDDHINPKGWAGTGIGGQATPNPAVASAAAGWREYGTTDLQGVPLDLSHRYPNESYILTTEEFENGFSNRAQIFAAFNGGQGWNPQ
ncbi:Pectinesterase [Diplonema papillatum]|nr:Pectinesterase [Diplonema papillatum]|eukprot:gene3801-5930_t